MGDVSDIEVLLKAAKRHAALVSWGKAGLIAGLSAIGAFFGAGWTARGYLEQLATKDSMASLMAGQKTVTDSLETHVSRLDERAALCEEHDRSQDKTADRLHSDLQEVQNRPYSRR
jgi:hypothetical protein